MFGCWGKEGEQSRGRESNLITLFGCFLREEGEGFGGVLTTSNPSFSIPPNWSDLKGEQSIEIFDQINYKIYPYHINKITNKKTNYSLPPYLILKTSK